MLEVIISAELKSICPDLTLGCLQAYVEVEAGHESLWDEINRYCAVLQQEIPLEELAALSRIKAGREVYRKLGKVPSKYRSSSEALLRRVLQGKGVYKINNVVDINNLVSLKSKFPVGTYNVEKLEFPVSLTIGKEGERYKGIGKELLGIENIPVLRDSLGAFGSPTSDSERAMISGSAKEILMCIYSFSGREDLEEYLAYACELLKKFASAEAITSKLIE